MRNFQDTFETRKRSFISAFSVCVTAHLNFEGDNINESYNKYKINITINTPEICRHDSAVVNAYFCMMKPQDGTFFPNKMFSLFRVTSILQGGLDFF